jgi:hypothetical protein
MANKPGPKKGSKQSAAHTKKISKALEGKKNPSYKDGRRSYRRIAGATNNDGNVIMHLDGNRKNNSKSNLKISKGKKPGANSTSEHEQSPMTKKERGRLKKKKK